MANATRSASATLPSFTGCTVMSLCRSCSHLRHLASHVLCRYVASVNQAHEAHGSGWKSRISLDFEKLKNAACMIEEHPKSSSGTLLQFSYRNREGKSLKSAKEVKQQVDAEGRLEEFVSNATKNQNQVQKLRFRLSNDLLSSDETDD